MTLHDNQLVIGTKLYIQNPNISSRELAKNLPNSRGNYGVRLQIAQEILRTIKGVEKNPAMIQNPYGQKGKPKSIKISWDNNKIGIGNPPHPWENPLQNENPNRIRRYKYYLWVTGYDDFYPYSNPVTQNITYGINNISDLEAVEYQLRLKYGNELSNNTINYVLLDADGNEITRYDI